MKKAIFTIYFTFLFGAIVMAAPITTDTPTKRLSPKEIKKVKAEKRAHHRLQRRARADEKICPKEARALRKSRRQLKRTVVL